MLLDGVVTDVEFQARLAAFYWELPISGWTIGRNVRINTRWATNAAEVRRHAAELARCPCSKSPQAERGW
jgi:hypothetical protein